MIVNVQRSPTNVLPGFKAFEYPTRPQKLNLPTFAQGIRVTRYDTRYALYDTRF